MTEFEEELIAQLKYMNSKQYEYADALIEQFIKLNNNLDNLDTKLDDSNESLGKRIRNAKIKKVPYVIVIGDKEKDASLITVETRTEKLEGITPEAFIEKIQKEIKERTLN